MCFDHAHEKHRNARHRRKKIEVGFGSHAYFPTKLL